MEDDDAFCRSSIGYGYQDDTRKYQLWAKTRTNERHDETSERGRDTSCTKPDDFHAKYEHMMGGSGLIGFPADSMGWCGRPNLDHESMPWELARASLMRDMPKISPRRLPVFWPCQVRTTWLPFGNR